MRAPRGLENPVGDMVAGKTELFAGELLLARQLEEASGVPKRKNAGLDAMVDDPFGDRGTEPADARMLLDGRHQLEPGKCLFEAGDIKRLDGVEAHHLGGYALAFRRWPASTASGSMVPVDRRQTSAPSVIVSALPMAKSAGVSLWMTGSPFLPIRI